MGERRGRRGIKKHGSHYCIVERVTSLVVESCPWFSSRIHWRVSRRAREEIRICRATNFCSGIQDCRVFLFVRPLLFFPPRANRKLAAQENFFFFLICNTRTSHLGEEPLAGCGGSGGLGISPLFFFFTSTFFRLSLFFVLFSLSFLRLD